MLNGLPSRSLPCAFALASILLAAPLDRGASSGVQTIHNEENGRWDDDASKKMTFVEDLVIGKEDGDENEIFGRVSDIAVSTQGEIYVLDGGFVRVQKFNSDGIFLQTIGRWGPGPGEFTFPTAITLDASGRLYVADRRTVHIFDTTGEPLDQFKIDIPDGLVRFLRVDPAGNIFVVCFDVFQQKILHKYSPAYEHLVSFCDSYAIGQEVDVRAERAFANGAIDLGADGLVYYTQAVPYEIRRFSSDGELLSVIHRENSFMEPPIFEKRGKSYSVGMPTRSHAIIALDGGRFLNLVVRIPSEPEGERQTFIDLFDRDGTLLLGGQFAGHIGLKCRDEEGRLYATLPEEYPKFVRYRLLLE